MPGTSTATTSPTQPVPIPRCRRQPFATLGLGDGPTNKAVTLKVSDGQNTVTSTTTLAVNNVAPTAGATATPGTIIAPAGLSLTASDAAAADNLAGFTFQIDWGDGSPSRRSPPAAATAAAPMPAINTT